MRQFAVCGVIAIASVVFVVSVAVPASGGPNAVSSVSATKLAKKALKISKRADRRSRRALKKAQPGKTGPTGPAGAAGTAGTAGTARAYGLVSFTGALSRSKNVVSVSHPLLGVWCISLASGIDPATTAPVVSVDFAQSATGASGTNDDDEGGAQVRSVPANCSSGQLEIVTGVQTFTAGSFQGNVATDLGFFFAVP